MKKLIIFMLLFPAVCGADIAQVMNSAKPQDWRAVDTADLLYMELPAGRVVIELAPDFAPKHVANVRALAHAGYWDGLAIVRVQDNYVVQWADAEADKPDRKRKIDIPLQTSPSELDVPLNPKTPFKKLPDQDTYAGDTGFSDGFASARDRRAKKMWLLHCYGAVGVGRDVAPESGDGTELYAVIGQAPRQLDRNVTLIGRVIDGMEYLSSLPRGHGNLGFYEKPSENIKIKSIRLASEVPEKDRVNYEVLKTDTPLFDRLIQARRNRREEWFHYQAGHIDACNLPVPARKRAR